MSNSYTSTMDIISTEVNSTTRQQLVILSPIKTYCALPALIIASGGEFKSFKCESKQKNHWAEANHAKHIINSKQTNAKHCTKPSFTHGFPDSFPYNFSRISVYWILRSSHLHELPQLGEGSRKQLQQLRLHVWGVGPHCEKVEGGKL